jgi:hypothetical protein
MVAVPPRVGERAAVVTVVRLALGMDGPKEHVHVLVVAPGVMMGHHLRPRDGRRRHEEGENDGMRHAADHRACSYHICTATEPAADA